MSSLNFFVMYAIFIKIAKSALDDMGLYHRLIEYEWKRLFIKTFVCGKVTKYFVLDQYSFLLSGLIAHQCECFDSNVTIHFPEFYFFESHFLENHLSEFSFQCNAFPENHFLNFNFLEFSLWNALPRIPFFPIVIC